VTDCQQVLFFLPMWAVDATTPLVKKYFAYGGSLQTLYKISYALQLQTYT
jgi:hypothetical protein